MSDEPQRKHALPAYRCRGAGSGDFIPCAPTPPLGTFLPAHAPLDTERNAVTCCFPHFPQSSIGLGLLKFLVDTLPCVVLSSLQS